MAMGLLITANRRSCYYLRCYGHGQLLFHVRSVYLQACCIIQLMKYIVKLQEKGASVATELKSLFAGELNPVAPKAQKKVPVPEGYVCGCGCVVYPCCGVQSMNGCQDDDKSLDTETPPPLVGGRGHVILLFNCSC